MPNVEYLYQKRVRICVDPEDCPLTVFRITKDGAMAGAQHIDSPANQGALIVRDFGPGDALVIVQNNTGGLDGLDKFRKAL